MYNLTYCHIRTTVMTCLSKCCLVSYYMHLLHVNFNHYFKSIGCVLLYTLFHVIQWHLLNFSRPTSLRNGNSAEYSYSYFLRTVTEWNTLLEHIVNLGTVKAFKHAILVV